MGNDGKSLTLADVVTLQRGTTYKSALLGQPGPVLLGLASIRRNGGFRDDNLKTYGGESPEKLTLYPGDIYVSLKDVTQSADLLGSIARVPPHIPSGRVTQDTVKLCFIRKDIQSDYVYWLLRTPFYREYCRAHAIGTTNLSLAREDFLAFPVPHPKQRDLTIVEALEALENKIELNRQINETLEALAQTLFKNWFVDAAASKPKSWSEISIAEICEINSWTLGKNDELDQIEYVEISEVQRGNIATIQPYERGDEPSRARRRLRHGDTVLSTVRPDRGAYFLCLNPSPSLIASTGFAVLTPNKAPWSFIHAAMTQPEVFEYLGQHADGGAYPAVRPELIGKMTVPWPKQAELLESFHDVCAPLYERAEHNRLESRTLAELRDALLPKLLSGELRVPTSQVLVKSNPIC